MMTMDEIYNNAQKAVYARCAKQKRIIEQYEEQTPEDVEKIAAYIGFSLATAIVFLGIIL